MKKGGVDRPGNILRDGGVASIEPGGKGGGQYINCPCRGNVALQSVERRQEVESRQGRYKVHETPKGE